MTAVQTLQHLYLPAIECRWDVRFHVGAARNRVHEELETLHFYLRDASLRSRVQLLRLWLKRRAVLELTPWLQRVSRDCGLPFKSLQFRGQRRRWGSCTADGRISLNYFLLFLPPEHVQYVLIHELCHTVHFNHSAEFWELVASFLPNWQRLRKAVRYADLHLPPWAQLRSVSLQP